MMPKETLRRINDLSRLRSNWHSIASAVSGVAAEQGWRSGDVAMAEWVAQAAEASHLSANTIGRLVAAREFLHRAAGPDGPSKWGNPDDLPFSSVEILKRIDAMDADAAQSLLGPAMKGEMSVRELRERYEALASNRGGGRMSTRGNTKREGIAFIKAMQSALDGDLGAFGCTPTIKLYRRRVKDGRFACGVNAIAFDPQDISGTITGFDGYPSFPPGPRHLFLYRIAYLSGFFAKYVAVFPSEVDQEGLFTLLDTLWETGRTNIDIALLNADAVSHQKVKLLRSRMGSTAPVPDCRPLMRWEIVLAE